MRVSLATPLPDEPTTVDPHPQLSLHQRVFGPRRVPTSVALHAPCDDPPSVDPRARHSLYGRFFCRPRASSSVARPWDPAEDYETKVGAPIYAPASSDRRAAAEALVRRRRREEQVTKAALWVCGTLALLLAAAPLLA